MFLQVGPFVSRHQLPHNKMVGPCTRGSADANYESCGTKGGVGKVTARGPGTVQCPLLTERLAP